MDTRAEVLRESFEEIKKIISSINTSKEKAIAALESKDITKIDKTCIVALSILDIVYELAFTYFEREIERLVKIAIDAGLSEHDVLQMQRDVFESVKSNTDEGTL